MSTIEALKRRMVALAPSTQAADPAALMTDEEIEQRARDILAGNTDHIDQDLVQKARTISTRRGGMA